MFMRKVTGEEDLESYRIMATPQATFESTLPSVSVKKATVVFVYSVEYT